MSLVVFTLLASGSIYNREQSIMNAVQKFLIYGSVAAFACLGFVSAAVAQDVSRLAGGNANSPISQAVTVPPGYTTYYISGTPAGPADRNAPVGSVQRNGDTATQTTNALTRLGDSLKALGLTYGDVVKATVFIAPDPSNGGKIDFAAMNKSWSNFFGTPQQPNKPARSTIQVGLVSQGGLIEIEMIAVKKNN
jgi:enamine deaminase RidA (YjgF/YER057c/UK114 family)